MNKKILLISAILLILTVALTACKSKTYNPVDGGKDENTDKVVQTVTVTGEDGGVTTVEIFEDEDGEKYITNVDGEKVPLTTDDQGFSDDIGFLVTSKPSAENKPSSPSLSNTSDPSKEAENNSGSTQPSSNAGENSTADESSTSSENSTGGGIIIDSTTKQDSIDWEDIKNPKN